MTSTKDKPESVEIARDAVKTDTQLNNNKTVSLYDNTMSIDIEKMKTLLSDLISASVFGINALSSSDGIIYLDKPKLSHIQIDDNLYRLYVFRYYAIIEKF